MATTPWERYAVEDLDAATKCSHLYHVAHVADARRIVEDSRMNPELVRDESVLNRTRICVVWTSPNTWYAGSLYGNVSFTLPLSTLEKRHFYWVEAMTKYNPTALRILVSAAELTSKHLTEFDPAGSDAPLHRSKDGAWWRRDELNYEIMFDEWFLLDECERIDFFDHHGRLCNKHRGSVCPETGREKKAAAARIAALALAMDEPDDLVRLLLAPGDDSTLVGGLARIAVWLGNRSYTHMAPTREDRASLLAATMHHYAYELSEHAKASAGGIGSANRAEKLLLRRVKEIFGEDISMKVEHALE